MYIGGRRDGNPYSLPVEKEESCRGEQKRAKRPCKEANKRRKEG